MLKLKLFAPSGVGQDGSEKINRWTHCPELGSAAP